MDFGYRIRLNSIQKINSEILMNYQGTIFATRLIIRCEVGIEDDTCKIILPPKSNFNKYLLQNIPYYYIIFTQRDKNKCNYINTHTYIHSI